MKVWPYILPLPEDGENLSRFLRSIFGSKVAVEILKRMPVDGEVYQSFLIKELNHSNKTIIKSLNSLVALGMIEEHMKKVKRGNRTLWVKFYKPTDLGKWFIMLLSPIEEIDKELIEESIINLFKLYISNILKLCGKYNIDPRMFESIVKEGLNLHLSSR